MSLVSLIILNWNGKHFLNDCLKSVSRIKYKPLEVIVVDNNSTDGSQEFVKKNYPKFKLIENKENFGFAEGNNIGFRASKGEYVMFLNNDTKVEPDFINFLIDDFKTDKKIGCLQPQMRVMKDRKILDEAGSFMSFTGFLYHYGYRKSYKLEKYNKKREIFSAKGACIIFPRKVLDKIGVFDKDFFIFFEETDLCFRVWLAGYTVMYEPKSVIYHFVGGDTSSSNKYNYERRMYLTFKNMNLSYIKNFGTKNFLTIYPIFFTVQFCVILYSIVKLRFGVVGAIFRAYLWNLLNLKSTLIKRKKIQHKLRKVSDSSLNKHIKLSPRLSYYYYSLFKTTEEYND